MPVLIWSGISGLVGVIAGLVYQSETNKEVVKATSATAPSQAQVTCWKYAVFAAAGVAAYWVYRSTK